MSVKDAIVSLQNLSLANLQAILTAMNRPQTGRAASLQARVTRILKDSSQADECARVVHRICNPDRPLPIRQRAVADTTSRMSESSDFDDDSRSSAQSPEEIFSRLPIHPDVKFKSLPFYEQLAELIKPTSLNTANMMNCVRPSENFFKFVLTPAQAQRIKGGKNPPDYLYQVLLRIGLNETTSEQLDCFPPGIAVRVNGHQYPLPPVPNNAVNPEKMQPLSITQFIRLDPVFPNQVQISARPHFQRFVIAIYLVKKLTSQNLLNSLRNKGVKVACYTKAMIIQKLKSDENEIALTYLLVKLTCPLSKKRIQVPCRATTCEHVQCFDCWTYLQLNERKPTWLCPVCNKSALFENLSIDEYFQEILASKLADGSNEVQLMKDGNWCPVGAQTDQSTSKEAIKREKETNEVELLTLSDSEDECAVVSNWPKSEKSVRKEVEVLDLSDDSLPPLSLPPKKRILGRSILPAPITKASTSNDDGVIWLTSDSGGESDGVSKGSSSSYDSDSGDHVPRLNPASLRARLCIPKVDDPASMPGPSENATSKLKSVQYAINQAKSSSTTLVISKKMPSDTSAARKIPIISNVRVVRKENDFSEKTLIVASIIEDILREVCKERPQLPSIGGKMTAERAKTGRVHLSGNDSGSSSDGSKSQACMALLGLANSAALRKRDAAEMPSSSQTRGKEHKTCDVGLGMPDKKNKKGKDEFPLLPTSQKKAEKSFRPSILRHPVRAVKESLPISSPPRSGRHVQDFSSDSDSSENGRIAMVNISSRKSNALSRKSFERQKIYASLNSDSSEDIWDGPPPFTRSMNYRRHFISGTSESSDVATSCDSFNSSSEFDQKAENLDESNRSVLQGTTNRKLSFDEGAPSSSTAGKCSKIVEPRLALPKPNSSPTSSFSIRRSSEPKGVAGKKRQRDDEVSSSFVPAILKRARKKCVQEDVPSDCSGIKKCRKELLTPVAELPDMEACRKKSKQQDTIQERGLTESVDKDLDEGMVKRGGSEDTKVSRKKIKHHKTTNNEKRSTQSEEDLDEEMRKSDGSEAGCSEARRSLRPRAPLSYHERSPSPLLDDEQSEQSESGREPSPASDKV